MDREMPIEQRIIITNPMREMSIQEKLERSKLIIAISNDAGSNEEMMMKLKQANLIRDLEM